MRRSTVTLIAALLLAGPAAATPPTSADRELLAAADLGLALPAAFHSAVQVEPLVGGTPTDFDVWRSGDLALVRFADPKQRGKAFLQRPEGSYLLAHGARPVKLGSASRVVAGLSLQELVGLAFSRDFTLADVTRAGTGDAQLVSFDLRARSSALPYPRVTYVVRGDTRRPVRIEYRLANGHVARIVEIAEWRPGARLVPAETVAKDLVGGRAPVRVRILALDERRPPAQIFELSSLGEAARNGLLAIPAS